MHKEIHKITKKMKYKLRKKTYIPSMETNMAKYKKKKKVTTHTLNYL